MTDIGNYLSFMLKLLFAFGIAFEMPIIVNLLIRTGTVSKARLRELRPYLVVLFFILGMLLTPPDMFSQLFLAIPMWMLFELGLLVSKEKTRF
jgi:sec-independent protein translocase protein TatC